MSKVFPAITKWEDWQISFSKKCPVKLDKKDKNKYVHALDIKQSYTTIIKAFMLQELLKIQVKIVELHGFFVCSGSSPISVSADM